MGPEALISRQQFPNVINEYKIRPIDNEGYKCLGQELLAGTLETIFPAPHHGGRAGVIIAVQ